MSDSCSVGCSIIFYMCSYTVLIIVIPECLTVVHWIINIHCIFVLSASPKETSVCEREFLLAIKAMHRHTVICTREGTLQDICLVIRAFWWFFNSCDRTFNFLLAAFSVHLGLLQKGEAPLSHGSIFIEILTHVCEYRKGGCLFNRLAVESVELQWELEGTSILFFV